MDIGIHCSFPSCRRLDFLPFSCDSCQQIFCKEHQMPDTHDCSGLHSKDKPLSSSSDTTPTSSRLPLSFPCSLKDCKRRDKVEIHCPYCHQVFCIQHRHQQDHSCPALVHEEKLKKRASGGDRERSQAAARAVAGARDRTTAAAERSGTSTGPKVIRGSRSESTRAKVAIMKLKLKAEGVDSIPQSERVYYDVQLPKESGLPNKAMFFSKEWSIGKIVDVISQKFRLRNENNKQHGQKLVLHSSSDEAMDLSKPLSSYLDNCPSGSLVSLEYINVSLS